MLGSREADRTGPVTWSTSEATGQSARTRRAITKAVVKAVTRKEHTLEYLQGKWADITLPVRPPPYPTVGNVWILHPEGSHRPKAESIALGWVLHGLDQRRLVSVTPPTVKLLP